MLLPLSRSTVSTVSIITSSDEAEVEEAKEKSMVKKESIAAVELDRIIWKIGMCVV